MYFLLFISILCAHSIQPLIFDFGVNNDSKNWVVVNDDVMGGLSTSQVVVDSIGYIFSGDVSLDNNGGFASLRSPRDNYNLEIYTVMKIRYKSTDRDFAIVLERHNQYYMPYHKQICESNKDGWVTSEFLLSEFKEYRLGEETGNVMESKSLQDIRRFGIVINDKAAGPFRVEVDYIAFK